MNGSNLPSKDETEYYDQNSFQITFICHRYTKMRHILLESRNGSRYLTLNLGMKIKAHQGISFILSVEKVQSKLNSSLTTSLFFFLTKGLVFAAFRVGVLSSSLQMGSSQETVLR